MTQDQIVQIIECLKVIAWGIKVLGICAIIAIVGSILGCCSHG
jgi:hypothetical protein